MSDIYGVIVGGLIGIIASAINVLINKYEIKFVPFVIDENSIEKQLGGGTRVRVVLTNNGLFTRKRIKSFGARMFDDEEPICLEYPKIRNLEAKEIIAAEFPIRFDHQSRFEIEYIITYLGIFNTEKIYRIFRQHFDDEVIIKK